LGELSSKMTSPKRLKFQILQDRFNSHSDFQNRLALIKRAFAGHTLTVSDKPTAKSKPDGILVDEWDPVDNGRFFNRFPLASTVFGLDYGGRKRYEIIKVNEDRLQNPTKKILHLEGNCMGTVYHHNYQAYHALIDFKKSNHFNFAVMTFFDFETAQKFMPSLMPFEAYIIDSSHPRTYKEREEAVNVPHVALDAISKIRKVQPSAHISFLDGINLCDQVPEMKNVKYFDRAEKLNVEKYVWPNSWDTSISVISDRMGHIDAAHAIRSVYSQAENRLTENEKEVIRWRYGVDIGEYKSFAEIGRQLGGNEDLAKKTESRALEKIRPFLKKAGYIK